MFTAFGSLPAPSIRLAIVELQQDWASRHITGIARKPPDALSEIIDESIDKISASLVSLEIKGYVLALPGRRYTRAEN